MTTRSRRCSPCKSSILGAVSSVPHSTAKRSLRKTRSELFIEPACSPLDERWAAKSPACSPLISLSLMLARAGYFRRARSPARYQSQDERRLAHGSIRVWQNSDSVGRGFLSRMPTSPFASDVRCAASIWPVPLVREPRDQLLGVEAQPRSYLRCRDYSWQVLHHHEGRGRETGVAFTKHSAQSNGWDGRILSTDPSQEPILWSHRPAQKVRPTGTRRNSYSAATELWFATSFHIPCCRTKTSVLSTVLTRCSPRIIAS